MAEREVRWTVRALRDKMLIYEYWIQRNQSIRYPTKLEILFKRSLTLTAKFPLSGNKTEIQDVRFKIVKDYKIFYRITSRAIEVVTVWDSRRNPDDLKI